MSFHLLRFIVCWTTKSIFFHILKFERLQCETLWCFFPLEPSYPEKWLLLWHFISKGIGTSISVN